MGFMPSYKEGYTIGNDDDDCIGYQEKKLSKKTSKEPRINLNIDGKSISTKRIARAIVTQYKEDGFDILLFMTSLKNEINKAEE